MSSGTGRATSQNEGMGVRNDCTVARLVCHRLDGNAYNLAMKKIRNVVMLAAFLSTALGFCDDPKAVSVNAASLHLIRKVEPQYSQLAKMAHIQGDVVIAITVTETG